MTATRPPLGGAAVDAALREMLTSDPMNGRWRIGMPVVACTGSSVDVSVFPEGDGSSFLVSDDGFAYGEVVASGASHRSFARVARDRCDRYGATFDGENMLFIKVAAEKLRGAIVAMANLVKEVTDQTIENANRAKYELALDTMQKRIEEAFPKSRIEIGAEVHGFSTALYKFDALVETAGKVLVFDYFTKDGNSLNSAYVKFSDIGHLERGPRPVGVTRSLVALGPRLTLISRAADVIEVADPATTYERLAA